MGRFARLGNEFLRKMENHTTAEAIRLGKSNHGKLRLIGTAIGVVVVILLGLWMTHHPYGPRFESTHQNPK